MNKTDLLDSIVEKTGMMKKDSEKVLGALLEAVSEALARGEKVQLVRFGTFETRTRIAREGRNPSTGETIKIPEQRVPAFRAGKALRDMVK